MDRDRKRRRGIGITTKLIALAIIPAMAGMIVLLIFSQQSLTGGMSTQSLKGLEQLAQATIAGYESYDGDYHLDDSGELWKGSTNLSERMSDIDLYTEGSNADVTICYGKTRKLTSLTDSSTQERIIGTDVSDAVWASVQKGETYEATDIVINGQNYYACYLPLYNSDGSIVGVVFAGEPSESVQEFISEKVETIVLIAIVAMVVAALIGLIVAKRIANCLVRTRDSLESLAEGDLTTVIDPGTLRRRDEIGQMGAALQNLTGRLIEIVRNLKASSDSLYESGNKLDEMAGQSSLAADEISSAVDEISKGAVSQAEDIQNASKEISTMGTVIENIVENVGSLTDVSQNMSDAGDASMTTMQELSDSNDRTTDAITRIAEQIKMTNSSIEKINKAAALITYITNQTSLLALNASIESARAGEAGRGFAVVATEIQNLAVQSDDAAGEIQTIIKTLQNESKQTIQIMNEAEELVKEQQANLDATKERFGAVSTGITESKENTDVIRTNADSCNGARERVLEVISNLSSISEENAASAEETTASMEELNANINLLAEAAKKLQQISENLNKIMDFFKL
jgi:methyl-accepting chemotaxis protein